MKSKFTFGSAVLAMTVLVVPAIHAQRSTSSDEHSSITITGCLQGDRGVVGTSGTTGGANAAADSTSFRLINARVGNAPGGGSGVTTVAPAGSGTNEAAVRAGDTRPSAAITGAMDKHGEPVKTPATYMVRGDNPELPRHVGQEVEISGRLIEPTMSSGAATSTSSTSVAANSAAMAGVSGQIEAKTIRMIASACAAE